MAYADSILTTAPTMEAVAALINNIYGTSAPITISTWTPTLTVTAPMTYTATSITYARYFRLGTFTYFAVAFSGTIGGTPSAIVNFSLPTTMVSASPSFGGDALNNGLRVSATAVQNTTTTMDCRIYSAAALTAGTVAFNFTGFYETA